MDNQDPNNTNPGATSPVVPPAPPADQPAVNNTGMAPTGEATVAPVAPANPAAPTAPQNPATDTEICKCGRDLASGKCIECQMEGGQCVCPPLPAPGAGQPPMGGTTPPDGTPPAMPQ